MFNNDILNLFEKKLNSIRGLNDLEKLKVEYLGRNGLINNEFKKLQLLNDKHKQGKALNEVKKIILDKIKVSYQNISNFKIKPDCDITLPGFGFEFGTKHIITSTLEDIENFFTQLGFEVKNGYEIDTTYYNFQALNMPMDHPSRNLQESFYISNKHLLRTHTSNMQIHAMKEKNPPLKIISYGKVYRRDYDASHTPMFHQLEGFIIDKNISIVNLKYILFNFLRFFFNKNININFRSSYFPFTEPSMEIDIECINCNGKKCSLCKNSGWIEVLGCGVIHPNVLTNCNIDCKLYKGIAFGMGVERLSMIKHKIIDIRLYFENNVEFLKQF